MSLGYNQQFIKLFVVLFFSTAFIFSFSHFGAKAFVNITNADGKFSEGTTVGSVDLSGKSEDEAISLLEEKYIDWLKNTKMELQFSEKIVPFDLNQFYFDAEQTVSLVKDGQQNIASITIEMLQVEEQLKLLFPEVDTSTLELTKITKDLADTASQFNNGEFSFDIYANYLLADDKKDVVISEAIVEMKDVPFDLKSFVANNTEIKIPSEGTFSLLEFAKQQKLEVSYSLNVIATGIYQVILPSNFSISERNISKALPEYAILGFEALVSESKGTNLVFVNPNKTPYSLGLKLENQKLFVTLKGEKLLYNYEITKKDEQQLKPKTIIQYSPLLHPGKTTVQTVGKDGIIVKVYRDIYQGSQLVESQLISEDYYPPDFRVEIHGLEGTGQTQAVTGGTTTGTVPNGTQTPTTSDTDQQYDDDLWGKPNEQPK